MREKAMALILTLVTVSAVSGTVAAVATVSKGVSACFPFPSGSDDEDEAKVVLQRVSLEHFKPKARAVR